MILLALDLCGDPHRVALCDDGGGVRARVDQPGGPSRAARAGPTLCAAALRQADLRWSDVDRLAVARGPGGFTGLRAALAFMLGVARATGAPLIGVSVFAALHAAAGGPAAAVVPAGRGELYLRSANPALGDRVGLAEDLTALVGDEALIGPGAPSLAAFARGPVLSDAPADPVWIARLAASRDPAASPPAPLYIRPPAVSPPAADKSAGLARG